MHNYNETEQKLVDKLVNIGFYISSKGFKYIVDGIILTYNNDMHVMDIYNKIAKKYHCTIGSVERAIRADITSYYDREIDIPQLLQYDYHKSKLPNKEFLYRLAYMFRDILAGNTNKY